MKKVYTILGSTLLAGSLMAQSAVNDLPFRSMDKSTSGVKTASKSVLPAKNHQKAVLLTEDFESVTSPALPAGFTAQTQSSGQYQPAGGNSQTGPNGYAGFYTGDETDANIGGFWPVPNNGSSTFAMCNDDLAGDFLCEERLVLPVLDFTGQTAMSISFDAFHDKNYGSGDATVQVSTDGGSTWTTVFTLPVDAANWQSVVADLSAYDGMMGVTIGIMWSDGGDCGAGDNWGTGLAVDNIVVENVLPDNITANWVLSADITQDLEYTMIPTGQVRPMGITAGIGNNGSNAQPDVNIDYDISFGGTSQDAGAGTAKAIGSFATDTIYANSTFTPSQTGVYTITADATMAAVDGNPADNSISTTLEVTDFIWARDQTTFDGAFTNVANANGAGVKIGHNLFVTADQTFGGVDIGIASSAGHDGQLVFGQLYYFDGAAGDWVFLETTEDHVINNAVDGGNIISLCFLSEVNVTAGMDLMVVAGHYGGLTDGSDAVRIATAGVAREGTVLGFDGANSAFQLLSPPAPVVRLNADLTCHSSINENNVSFTLGQNYPNPAMNETSINYSLVSTENVSLEVTDAQGRVIEVLNLGTQTAGEYTVNINTAAYNAGMYFYTLSNGSVSTTKTMTITK